MRLDTSRWWLAFAAVVTVVVYFSGGNRLDLQADVLSLRWEFLLILGIFTWVLMTVCVVIPARWSWMNALAGGLDTGYGIHKWVGVTAVCVVFLHWSAVQSWRWMAGWGWLDGRDVMSSVLSRLGDGGAFPLDPISRLGGGAAFFLMAAVVAVALIKKIPYHVFRDIHKIAPAVYVLASVHVLNRIPSEWWKTPAAYVLAALTLVGMYASIISLLQAIGKKRRYKARITRVVEEESGIVDLAVEMERPFAHKSGQFAFIDFTCDGHGSHPFSMASSDPEQVRFLIKKLGDATEKTDDILEPGQTIELEGPYGRFDFASDKPRQAWIAGGIGIAPFISRLEELANRGVVHQQVDFWYSVDSDAEAGFPANLAELCRRAGVTLHTVISERDERLRADEVAAVLGNLADGSVWFCGPDGFGEDIKRGLRKKGLSRRDFHSERFDFR